MVFRLHRGALGMGAYEACSTSGVSIYQATAQPNNGFGLSHRTHGRMSIAPLLAVNPNHTGHGSMHVIPEESLAFAFFRDCLSPLLLAHARVRTSKRPN